MDGKSFEGNQFTAAAGGASFAYDANGNLTGDGANGYLYDVENRLVARSGGGSAGLRYDPLGRLYEVAGGALGTQRFLYDGDALVAEYDGAGALLRRYVHGADAGVALRQAQGDRPLVWYEGGGVAEAARRDLFADERGSIVAVTDAAGNVTAINTYDEYGIPDDAAPASLATKGRLRYTGQTLIPELGLYHYKARMYSPTLGRFMQTDPIGYEDGPNIYAYVGNDPVNGIDPTGMYQCLGNSGQCAAYERALRSSEKAARSDNLSRSERAKLRDTNEYIRDSVNYFIAFDDSEHFQERGVPGEAYTEHDKELGISVTVLTNNFATKYDGYEALDPNFSSSDARAGEVAHEGRHALANARGEPSSEKEPRRVEQLINKANETTPKCELGTRNLC